MRIREQKFENVEVTKLFAALKATLSNISVDNMQAVEVTGTTNATADTQSFFPHGLKAVPSFWLVLEGRIYIPRNGVNEEKFDIRSAETAEPFRMLAIL